jgi:hypothetical protein
MRESDDTILQRYGDYITSALQTKGGHLSIGRGGYAELRIMRSCHAREPGFSRFWWWIAPHNLAGIAVARR